MDTHVISYLTVKVQSNILKHKEATLKKMVLCNAAEGAAVNNY